MTMLDKLKDLAVTLRKGELGDTPCPDARAYCSEPDQADSCCYLGDCGPESPWETGGSNSKYMTFDEFEFQQDLVELVQAAVGPGVKVTPRWGCWELGCSRKG